MDIAEGGCESECAGKIRVRGNKSYKGIASGHKDAGWVVGVKYKDLLLNVPVGSVKEVRNEPLVSIGRNFDVDSDASLIKSRPMVPRASANYTRIDQ